MVSHEGEEVRALALRWQQFLPYIFDLILRLLFGTWPPMRRAMVVASTLLLLLLTEAALTTLVTSGLCQLPEHPPAHQLCVVRDLSRWVQREPADR